MALATRDAHRKAGRARRARRKLRTTRARARARSNPNRRRRHRRCGNFGRRRRCRRCRIPPPDTNQTGVRFREGLQEVDSVFGRARPEARTPADGEIRDQALPERRRTRKGGGGRCDIAGPSLLGQQRDKGTRPPLSRSPACWSSACLAGTRLAVGKVGKRDRVGNGIGCVAKVVPASGSIGYGEERGSDDVGWA